jgi:hypothetical protein
MDHQLGPVVTNDRDDLKKLGIASWSEIQARVVVSVVNLIALSIACSMSSSATPCFRADEWISTREL